MAVPQRPCKPSLSGRYASALASLEALEDALRAEAAHVAEAAGVNDPGAWQQLEAAADTAMSAANTLRISKSHLAGARLRGADVP